MKSSAPPETSVLPVPPYLDKDWCRSQGIDDIRHVLAEMRPEDQVMRPTMLRALKPTRMSFARTLVERMIDERWRIQRVGTALDAEGLGTLTYQILAAGYALHFVVQCFPSTGTDRVGRVADMQYDFLGSFMDGPPNPTRDEAELLELRTRVWLGRTDNRSLGWTAANRSNRFFDHTVERLSEGKQPDLAFLASGGGYIVRNAGWLGNGRFGSRSWISHPSDHPLAHPYHCDIFALYLWRQVSFDVAEEMARLRSPDQATTLATPLKRLLGIGNSSGVGMVAALVRWPYWMSAYHTPRELALALVKRKRNTLNADRMDRFLELVQRAAAYYDEQPGCPVEEIEDPADVAAGLRIVAQICEEQILRKSDPVGDSPWTRIAALAARQNSPEVTEQVNSILIEVFPETSDPALDLFPTAMKLVRAIDPTVTVGEIRQTIAVRYAWALAIDRMQPGACHHFWYRSEDVGENRRGERAIDPGVEKETFVDVVGAIQDLDNSLAAYPADETIGQFLFDVPRHAHAVSRVQVATRVPYSEIRGNIIDVNFLPMDGIRFLLSTMGLESSHPFNKQWVRGVFLQGAPTTEDVAEARGGDWSFPSSSRLIDSPRDSSMLVES